MEHCNAKGQVQSTALCETDVTGKTININREFSISKAFHKNSKYCHDTDEVLVLLESLAKFFGDQQSLDFTEHTEASLTFGTPHTFCYFTYVLFAYLKQKLLVWQCINYLTYFYKKQELGHICLLLKS